MRSPASRNQALAAFYRDLRAVILQAHEPHIDKLHAPLAKILPERSIGVDGLKCSTQTCQGPRGVSLGSPGSGAAPSFYLALQTGVTFGHHIGLDRHSKLLDPPTRRQQPTKYIFLITCL